MIDRVLTEVAATVPEMVEFLREMIRIPTVNPPGEYYADFAEMIATRYRKLGYDVQTVAAEGHIDHTLQHPRINVLARMEGGGPGPCVHFNGHLDVVPAGQGWTREPFGGELHDGKVYGRGASDMKGGLAASLFAVEAIRRCGIRLEGAIEQSATVDEESGGFAGVAYLAERGYLKAGRQDHVIITEPHGADRICLGHRGVYWFDVIIHGHIAHGSMPFDGVNAIDRMSEFLSLVNTRLRPKLIERVTAMPVTPAGARHATLNLNSIAGGQPLDQRQTPCVPDVCTAVFDRRFLPEERIDDVRQEFTDLLKESGLPFEMRDRMVVMPVCTDNEAPVVRATAEAIERVYGRPPEYVASPGTYDQKHFVRIAKVVDCISYGPGIIEQAHQPDEYVRIDDLERSAQVMALATLKLLRRL